MDLQLLYVFSVLVAGVAAQWLGWRLRLPAIVVLLAVGLLLGPGLGVLDPEGDLGPALHTLVGMGVAIVVFEGGLALDFRELRESGAPVARLIVVGLPLTWGFGTLAAHWIGGMAFGAALLFGAILVVTGPTVILPMLRQVRLTRRANGVLKWESVVNDPIGALLAVVVVELLYGRILVGDADSLLLVAVDLLPALAASAGLGVAAAFFVRWAFHHDQVPELLKTPMLLAGALGLYAAGNAFYEEAGLAASTLFGLTLANIGVLGLKPLSKAKESLSILVVSALFVLLAADMDPAVLSRLSWDAAALVVVVLVAVRPVAVLIATLGSDLPWRERLLIAWIGPRGIVAAAMAGLAGSRLEAIGYEDAGLVLPMVFAVIVATVLAHGLTLGPLARWLGLRTSEKPGILIVGANKWTLDLAQTLRDLDVPVTIADRSARALRQVRKRGIAAMEVEILSDWVEVALDMAAVDYVLAATGDDAYNALICARFAPDLGRERVHQLALRRGRRGDRWTPGLEWRGKIVVNQGLDHGTANDLIDAGWRFGIRQPPREDEPVADQRVGARDLPLLTVREDGKIIFNTPEREAHARPGDRLIAFFPPTEAAA